MADLADKFTRNEILTSNEVRQIVGMLPSQDPNADVLRNKNISASDEEIAGQVDINGNPINSGMPPEGAEPVDEPYGEEPQEMPAQPAPQAAPEETEQPPNDDDFEDDPELDELIANLTEEEFNQLPEEEQQVILDYIKWKEAKQNA